MTGYIIFFVIGFIFGSDFKREVRKNPEDINFLELYDIISDMNSVRIQLKKIDKLLLDLQVSDDKTKFQIQWDDLHGSENNLDFSRADRQNLIGIFSQERDRLRSSLLESLDRIDRLRNGKNSGVNGTKGGEQHE